MDLSDTRHYRLDLDPMPAPRPRFRVITPKGRAPIASAYSPAEYRQWQDDAHEQLISQITHPELTGPLAVDILVQVQKPRTSKLDHPSPDVDNYAKAVMDAMTKAGAWLDDKQVVSLTVTKEWGGIGRIDVLVTPRARSLRDLFEEWFSRRTSK